MSDINLPKLSQLDMHVLETIRSGGVQRNSSGWVDSSGDISMVVEKLVDGGYVSDHLSGRSERYVQITNEGRELLQTGLPDSQL